MFFLPFADVLELLLVISLAFSVGTTYDEASVNNSNEHNPHTYKQYLQHYLTLNKKSTDSAMILAASSISSKL